MRLIDCCKQMAYCFIAPQPSFALIVCMICVYQQAANGAPTHSSVSSSRQPDSNDHTHSSNVRVVSSRTSAQKRALDSKMMSTDALSSNQPTYKPEISSHPSSSRSINDVEFDGTDVPNEYTAPKVVSNSLQPPV